MFFFFFFSLCLCFYLVLIYVLSHLQLVNYVLRNIREATNRKCETESRYAPILTAAQVEDNPGIITVLLSHRVIELCMEATY